MAYSIKDFFMIFDFSHIHLHAIWLLITYASVVFAMFVDLITGIRKAKAAGIATTSRLLKKTCDKSIKYFFPMLCLFPIDIMTSNFTSVPVFTMLMAAFNIYCEWKSVVEKTHTKKEIHDAAQTVSVIVKNKDDLAKVFAEVLAKISEEKKKDGEE